MRKISLSLFAALLSLSCCFAEKKPVDYVNPFIGTTNFGTCNPGAVCPSGMMSVVPFNVMGSDSNKYDKDSRWWSTPYEFHNVFFTGYSHVNLSGVGCPDLGSLLVMPTVTDTLCVDFRQYGSAYTAEQARPGYYTNTLTRYGVKTEVTATPRCAVHRYTFPGGRSHILLNLGEGLTNETGATLRRTAPNEVVGSKLLGTFCYDARQAVFPIYFVMRVERKGLTAGYWKFQRPKKGVEAEWDPDDNKYKLYTRYTKDLSGDDIGAWFSFDAAEGEQVEVRMGVSFVSIEGARRNLEAELSGKTFDQVRAEAEGKWNEDLSRILVEGGTEEEKTVFYTALYHLLLHPNILQDTDGRYPMMEGDGIGTVPAGRNRYTVFSLWDTYRNVHQLLSLVYPERQADMLRSMTDMASEWGWLPKWELYGRETFTMEGDPAIPVLADSYLKGLRDFDVEAAYAAARLSALTPGKENPMRPDNDDYMRLGYVPLRSEFDNSVSHALEYYVADNALALWANALGKADDARLFRQRALGWRKYFSAEYGTLRPLLPNGTFLTPFNPRQGENFEPSPGFHEGNAWNYTFYVPHDIDGLIKLMGGAKKFTANLQAIFDKGLYDPANEPDIAYPYLFARIKGEAWRTQDLTRSLLRKHFTTQPDGIPGNDDTGTMSAWAIFSMIGFYPDVPGDPSYTLTAPVFSRVTLRLDPALCGGREQLVITAPGASWTDTRHISSVRLGGKPCKGFRLTHKQLTEADTLEYELSDK